MKFCEEPDELGHSYVLTAYKSETIRRRSRSQQTEDYSKTSYLTAMNMVNNIPRPLYVGDIQTPTTVLITTLARNAH